MENYINIDNNLYPELDGITYDESRITADTLRRISKESTKRMAAYHVNETLKKVVKSVRLGATEYTLCTFVKNDWTSARLKLNEEDLLSSYIGNNELEEYRDRGFTIKVVEKTPDEMLVPQAGQTTGLYKIVLTW